MSAVAAPPVVTWEELRLCLTRLAASAEQVALAEAFVEGLSAEAGDVERLDLLEMIMVAASVVQAGDGLDIVEAAQALRVH